jgi:hypothetical protein
LRVFSYWKNLYCKQQTAVMLCFYDFNSIISIYQHNEPV